MLATSRLLGLPLLKGEITHNSVIVSIYSDDNWLLIPDYLLCFVFVIIEVMVRLHTPKEIVVVIVLREIRTAY